MKHLFLTVALCLAAFVLCPSIATAQRGETVVGINAGYASHNHSGYSNIYFQFTPVNHLRLSPEIGYIYRHEGMSAVNFALDVQSPFKVSRGVAVYPLAGFVFYRWVRKDGDNFSRAGVNLGGGLDFYFTNFFKVGVQAKYSFLKDTDGVFVGLGLGYIF